MKQVTGSCKFCGQTIVMNVPESYTEEDIIAEATKKCLCEEAQAENHISDMIACTESQIKELFKDKGMEQFKNFLLELVEPMARQKLQKLTIGAGRQTISMKRKKGSIEVSIKVVTEEKVES